MADLTALVGPLQLKNPVIAGSCEFTMSEAGIRACLQAGAGAVVAKSINERPEAALQLDFADYALIAPDRNISEWSRGGNDDSLLCRSGLVKIPLDDWLNILARCDEEARAYGSMVIGSVTVSDAARAADLAGRLATVVRCVELNLSAPHGREATTGAVRLLTDPAGVRSYTASVRAAVSCPLIVKLTGQTANVTALAEAAANAGADIVAMVGRFPGFLPILETQEPLLGSWGAIGGSWALPISCYWVSKTYRAFEGRCPIIGTNGARSGDDVVRFLLSGARAVEMASSLLIHGPSSLTSAIAALSDYVARRRLGRLDELVGAAADSARGYSEFVPKQKPWPWEQFLGS